MHFLTLVLINPFQNQSAVAIQLRATRSVMLTLFFTYPWEQNQTILFQLQGNLVINLVPWKPKTETKVPQTLGYFLGGKKKAIQNYQVDTWMKAMLQSLSHASSCRNMTMAASPFATKHVPTTANSTFATKLMFFGDD